MIASDVSDKSERIPLQASATSSGMAGRLMTLPSRSTGTPNIGRVQAASLEARICNGNVIWLNTMEGIGTIRSRNASGNSTARNIGQPQKKMTKPANKKIRDVRERNSSAPKTPKINVQREKTTIGNPKIEGLNGMLRSFSRFCQSTKTENAGTKNPCEKFGSVHH